MVVNLTNSDRVKRIAAISGSEDDTLIGEIIASVSDDAARYLGRHIHSIARTEEYRLHLHSNQIRLNGYPVSAVSSVKVNNTNSNWSTATTLGTDDYDLNTSSGSLYLRSVPQDFPTWVQVVYTGGMVSSSGDDESAATTNFIAAYPSLVGALDIQVAEILRRRRSPTGSFSVGRSNIQQQRTLGLLPDVRRRLDQLKPVRVY